MKTNGSDVGLFLDGRSPRLLCAVTASVSAGFYRGRLAYLKQRGYDVHLVSSPGSELEELGGSEGATAHALPMKRQVAPLADMVSLARAWRLLWRLKPDIVDAGTPKAGLLFSLAAALAGVPCRVYSLYGVRLVTTRGLLRWTLTLTGRVACACAHRIACISPSLRQRAVELRLARPDKFVVLGSGSIKGASVERFALSPDVQQQADKLRQELGIEAGVPVIGFVGRLVRDKGIKELVEAWLRLRPRFPTVTLLVVGAFEEADPVDARTRQLIETTPEIVAAGQVADVVPYYHLMDVLASATYREGFGEVALEAAAAGKPVVTTDAVGAVDSVAPGVTGYIVPVGDTEALAAALGRLLENPEMARKMGEAGRQRVIADFKPERIWREVDELYRGLYAERVGTRASLSP
jgi:glycosyltransferase involved in cell wall biosynthesis